MSAHHRLKSPLTISEMRSEPDERRQPQRRHKGDGALRNSPEQRIKTAEITNHKPSQQRADASAQRDFDASDGKAHENANDAPEENRKSQHDKIDTCAGSDKGADLRHRPFHDGFGANDAK